MLRIFPAADSLGIAGKKVAPAMQFPPPPPKEGGAWESLGTGKFPAAVGKWETPHEH